jgi:3-oxoacyl-[acyl-carrier protein] reductase
MSSPSSPLSGRVAIVTGVSRTNGIGFAVARRLGHIGTRLFLHGWPCAEDSRCEPDASEIGAVVADRLRAEGIVTQYIEHDLLDPAGPEIVVRAAVEAYGHVDIVDANHAYSRDDILETLEADEIDRQLLINVRGTLCWEGVRRAA